MTNYAIILAGGKGIRFGGNAPKQFQKINGLSVLERAIQPFLNCEQIDQILLVLPEEHLEFGNEIIAKNQSDRFLPVVTGGLQRHFSSFNALKTIAQYEPTNVLIHDAARPFLTEKLIEKLLAELKQEKAVIPVISSKDSLKMGEDYVLENVEREKIFQAQTPQAFDFQAIMNAYENVDLTSDSFTDDASIAQKHGVKVKMIEGEEQNFKVTTKEDLEKVKMSNFRIGHGLDFHNFDLKQKGTFQIFIGGVGFEHSHPIIAHSDGDVLLHALIDAMLGAAGLGDIGEMFPDSDAKWLNANSCNLLKFAHERILHQNYSIANIDVTIIAEVPKISPKKQAIKQKIAEILQLNESQINIKATTTEKKGFIGRQEAIGAEVVCLLFSA